MDNYSASNTIVYLFPHGPNAFGIINLGANRNLVTTSPTHPLLTMSCIGLDFNVPPQASTGEFTFGSRSDCDVIIPSSRAPLRHFSITLSGGSGITKIINKTDDRVVVDGEVLRKPGQWGLIRDGTSISSASCSFTVKLFSRSQEHQEAYTGHNIQNPCLINLSPPPTTATPCGGPENLCNRIRGRYIELSNLESMSSGPVCRLADETDGRVYTVKKRRGVEGIPAIQYEAEILRKLCHPNLAGLHRFFYDDVDDTGYLLINQQLYGNLLDHKLSDESELVRIFHQCLGALDYMHKKGIMHRNINAGSIEITRFVPIEVVITDFSFAAKSGQLDGKAGSSLHWAPETWKNELGTTAVDIWALAVTGLEITHAIPPENVREFQIYDPHYLTEYTQKIDEARMKLPIEYAEALAPMLEHDPRKRASAWVSLMFDVWNPQHTQSPEAL